jgi:hypothetical protein
MIAKPIEWLYGAEGHAWTDEFPKVVNVRYQISPTGFDGFKPIKFGAWGTVRGQMEKIGDYDGFVEAQEKCQRHYDNLVASLLTDNSIEAMHTGWDCKARSFPEVFGYRIGRLWDERFPPSEDKAYDD